MASAQTLQDQGPPLHRIVHRNTFAVRYNPVGLVYDGRFSYRLRLYESSSVALRDNFIGFGVAPMLSPLLGRVGAYVEVQPTTVLGFWATYSFVQYFGTFNLFQSFPSARSTYSDNEIARLGNGLNGMPGARTQYLANGTELTIGADFQLKVFDAIVIRSRARLVRPDMNLREGDQVFYDQVNDVLAPDEGWYLTNDVDLLYQTPDKRFVGGARYSQAFVFYDARHSAAGESPANRNNTHRVGPFVGYTFKSEDGASFNNPTVFLLVQWWLQNPNRTGGSDRVSQALPLMGVGFQMTGDFLPVSKPPPRADLPAPDPETSSSTRQGTGT